VAGVGLVGVAGRSGGARAQRAARKRALVAVRALPPHLVMVSAMAITMIGGHTALRSLLGVAILVGGSLVCAPIARTVVVYREHVVDYWVMALVLVVLLPRPTEGLLPDAAVHSHAALDIAGAPAIAGILAAWLCLRAAIVLVRRDRWRASLASAAPTVAGLALMLLVCG
jgi:hypothetical protein